MRLPKIIITKAMILESAIKQVEQRLRELDIALSICRHSKRKHQTKKIQRKLIHVHAELVKRLQSTPGH